MDPRGRESLREVFYIHSQRTITIMGSAAALLWVLVIASATHGSLAQKGDPMQNFNSRIAQGFTGAVSAEDARCSEIGRDIMAEKGGNAVDATVAVALCSGVVNPVASGIGGGAFLLFLPANATTPIALDFREVAPGAASENMYAEDEDLKSSGALSVAVPGEIAGLHLLWQQYGTLPWKTLFEPAIQLAGIGFVVQPYLAAAIQTSASSIIADEGLSEVFAPNGTLLTTGDICIWTALAKSLASIADEGPAAFYNGSIGKNFVDDVKDAGGILTMDDLIQYTPKIRDPIALVDVQGLSVYGMPPPSSAGACIALVLNILAAYPDPFQAVEGPLGLHRMVEAIKHAFAIRMNLSDPDFVNVTDVVSAMLDSTYAAEIRSLINDNKTYPSPYYGGSWSQLDDHGTGHFNIVDGDRNVVTMTSTVNYPFGAKIISKATGILMNNEMDDFSIPTSTGMAPPSPANFIAPYKRPLSSMAPTIVMKNGQFLAALGGSGGSKIITATLQVFLNSFWKGYEPLDSVSSPRLHHQLFPDVLQYEDWTTAIGDLIQEPVTVVEYLESKGHNATAKKGGVAEMIVQDISDPITATRGVHNGRIMRGVEPLRGMLTAVGDLRKDGSPRAF